MRLLVLFFCAMSLAGCAGSVAAAAAVPNVGPLVQAVPTPTTQPTAVQRRRPAPPSTDVVISYSRSGGLAGFADSYALRGDGSVTLVGSRRLPANAAGSVFTVDQGAAAMQQLVDAIAATGLYSQPPAGPAPLASGDRISYDLTIQHDGQTMTFTVVDGADQPAAFQQTLALVQQYIRAAQAK